MAVPDGDQLIAGILRSMLTRCRALEAAGLVPHEQRPALIRRGMTLGPDSVEEIVWRRLTVALTRTASIWEAALAAVNRLREDDEIEADIGFEDSTPMRADLLLKRPLEQILRHYHRDHPDWGWMRPTRSL